MILVIEQAIAVFADIVAIHLKTGDPRIHEVAARCDGIVCLDEATAPAVGIPVHVYGDRNGLDAGYRLNAWLTSDVRKAKSLNESLLRIGSSVRKAARGYAIARTKDLVDGEFTGGETILIRVPAPGEDPHSFRKRAPETLPPTETK